MVGKILYCEADPQLVQINVTALKSRELHELTPAGDLAWTVFIQSCLR